MVVPSYVRLTYPSASYIHGYSLKTSIVCVSTATSKGEIHYLKPEQFAAQKPGRVVDRPNFVFWWQLSQFWSILVIITCALMQSFFFVFFLFIDYPLFCWGLVNFPCWVSWNFRSTFRQDRKKTNALGFHEPWQFDNFDKMILEVSWLWKTTAGFGMSNTCQSDRKGVKVPKCNFQDHPIDDAPWY